MPVVSPKPAFNREAILETLWRDPIARVLGHDVPTRLQPGEEYLDLQRLEAGVQHAAGTMSPTGGELSRKAVQPATWDKLLASLGSRSAPRVSGVGPGRPNWPLPPSRRDIRG